ncbi:MAG: racemase [Hyphomicrobiales bacterium]|nr:MAG: racemase [Hyphomicrobiales bacterium]
MPTIKAVEARTVRIPLDAPVAFSTRRVDARHYTIARITCSDGSVGHGFCHGGTRFGGLASTAIRELFAPLMIGRDPHCSERIWQDLHQDTLLNGRAGAVMRALSAVDIALWDRNARSAGLPLWRYLGGFRTETVPAYASGGYYTQGGVADLRREIERAVILGFKAVKLKIGGASPADDAARIAIAREIVGPDGILLLDANNAWRDLASALRAIRPLLAYDIFLIEEPFGPDDYENHRRLATAIPVAIASGEILGGRHAHRDLIERGGVSILQPDAAVCGGVTEWRRIAAMAASAGVPVMPHSFHALHLHLVASVPNGAYVEYFPDDSILPFHRLLDRQVDTRGGEIVLPTTPGLGFEIETDALEWFALEPWS